jgi:cyclic pyranopterin monophosphate synthase
MSDRLTHIDERGQASMVDVSKKPTMRRTAVAEGFFIAQESTLDALLRGDLPKGEGIAVARIAGIQAAKMCDTLIPLCHPLPLEFAEVTFERVQKDRLKITSTTLVHGRTGIEMEALTAVSVAALTLWDMTKAIDKNLCIEGVRLVEKKKDAIST